MSVKISPVDRSQAFVLGAVSTLLFSTSVLITAVAFASNACAARPNILLIFADDLGWKDVGYQGSELCETPALDRLASEGMTFSNAYAAAGNCAPSRACLLSGGYTPRHGVYAVGSTKRGPKNLMRLEPIPNRHGLAASCVTMAEALQEAGYATGIFGKWHLDGKQGATPAEQGFDVVVDSRKTNPNADHGLTDDPKGIFSLTEAACQFIENHRDEPFFCYVSHHAIHTALEARPTTMKAVESQHPQRSHGQNLYDACTRDFDSGVRLLLEKLDSLGLAENTLVIFTSDNGATNQSPQEPLRGNKGSYYEGGIRVPFAARWPGKITAGSSDGTPIINIDLYPTFLAAAESDPPTDAVLDGENLLPLFRQTGSLARQEIFWHFPGYLNSPVIRGRDPVFRTRPVSVIRKGDWKLHLYLEEWVLDGGRDQLATNHAVELYNLRKDIGERQNLAKSNPQQRDALLNDLLAWKKQVEAPLPHERNERYQPNAANQKPTKNPAKRKLHRKRDNKSATER